MQSLTQHIAHLHQLAKELDDAILSVDQDYAGIQACLADGQLSFPDYARLEEGILNLKRRVLDLQVLLPPLLMRCVQLEDRPDASSSAGSWSNSPN